MKTFEDKFMTVFFVVLGTCVCIVAIAFTVRVVESIL